MAQGIIFALICLVAFLLLLESTKKKKVRRSSSADIQVEEQKSVLAADEADPTQSGRYRAMKVKAEIQRARQAKNPPKPKDEPRQDLPDPFNVELQDQD